MYDFEFIVCLQKFPVKLFEFRSASYLDGISERTSRVVDGAPFQDQFVFPLNSRRIKGLFKLVCGNVKLLEKGGRRDEISIFGGHGSKAQPIVSSSLQDKIAYFSATSNDFLKRLGSAWVVKEMDDVIDRSRLIVGTPFKINFSQFGLHDESAHVEIRIGKSVNRQKAWLTGEISRVPLRWMGGETKIVGGIGFETV